MATYNEKYFKVDEANIINATKGAKKHKVEVEASILASLNEKQNKEVNVGFQHAVVALRWRRK